MPPSGISLNGFQQPAVHEIRAGHLIPEAPAASTLPAQGAVLPSHRRSPTALRLLAAPVPVDQPKPVQSAAQAPIAPTAASNQEPLATPSIVAQAPQQLTTASALSPVPQPANTAQLHQTAPTTLASSSIPVEPQATPTKQPQNLQLASTSTAPSMSAVAPSSSPVSATASTASGQPHQASATASAFENFASPVLSQNTGSAASTLQAQATAAHHSGTLAQGHNASAAEAGQILNRNPPTVAQRVHENLLSHAEPSNHAAFSQSQHQLRLLPVAGHLASLGSPQTNPEPNRSPVSGQPGSPGTPIQSRSRIPAEPNHNGSPATAIPSQQKPSMVHIHGSHKPAAGAPV